MIKNATVFKLAAIFGENFEQLFDALATREHSPIGASEMQSIGFVPPYEDTGLVHCLPSGFAEICIRIDARTPNASAVREQMKERIADVTENQGYRPGRKQQKEIKEAIHDGMIPKLIPTTKYVRAYFVPGFLIIDTTSGTATDTVIGLLAKVFPDFADLGLMNVYTVQSPAQAMTAWIAADEAPANFTIDQGALLRASGDSRASIKYTGHTIDPDDVRRHIQSGKICTRLDMTWADRISFEFDSSMRIRRVAPLDVLKESASVTSNDIEARDGATWLILAEMSKLIQDMIAALGGEKE